MKTLDARNEIFKHRSEVEAPCNMLSLDLEEELLPLHAP